MSKHTERLDMTFCRIEEKIRDILGPLSRLWIDLEDLSKIRDDQELQLDIDSMLEKIHQSVILLGQAINTTLYQRRLYILSSICKDSMKAKSQLKEKADLFKGHKALFGSTYRKKIMAWSTEPRSQEQS